jgi:hypothetical protein
MAIKAKNEINKELILRYKDNDEKPKHPMVMDNIHAERTIRKGDLTLREIRNSAANKKKNSTRLVNCVLGVASIMGDALATGIDDM